MTTFNREFFDATHEPMFLGREVNVARYDRQKYPIIEQMIEKQLSFYWRPEEIDISTDRVDFMKLAEHERHIFTSNLKYQILLDSVQGRSPSLAFLPLCSLPELETWIQTWSFFETIHSRSYTHIIRNIFPNPSEVFDSIVQVPEVVRRAELVTKHYDHLIDISKLYATRGPGIYEIDGVPTHVTASKVKRAIYLALVAVYVLESVIFYVSFANSFAFVERGEMEGNGKIIRLIARDEAIHAAVVQHMLRTLPKDDPEFVQIAQDCEREVYDIFRNAAEQEKAWSDYLYQHGSMMGMNHDILCQYIEHLTNQRAQQLGLNPLFPPTANPIPWINSHLYSDNVQQAPQESEVSSYLVGQIDATLEPGEFKGIDL